MQDNPNEQSKPRFLAQDDGGSRQTGAYRGRFLNRQPSEDNAESPQESDAIPADIREGPESPLQSADAPFDASEPAQDDLSQEALWSQESSDFQDSDVSYGDDGDFSNFEAPEISEDTDASEDAAYTEYTNDVSPVQESLSEEDAEFQELFSAEPPQEDDIPVRDHPASKGRPKRRGGEGFLGIPNILVTIVWIAITVAIGVTLGRMAWVCAADVLAFGREDTKVTITISSTDDIDAIAQKLKNAGLIRYPGLFKLYASFAVDEGEIQPGIWDLNTLYDYHALVNMMSPSSKRSVVTIMIPEGSSCRQIFQLLQEKRVCTVEALENYAASGELGDYWFLEGITRGDKYCLEGYLFPDTYEFYTNDTAENVLNKMLGNFDSRVDESIRGQLDSLNGYLVQLMTADGRSEEYISSHLFSMADVITVASLIEKESASAEESYTIASVIYNRLFAWGSTPAYLNIDAAVI